MTEPNPILATALELHEAGYSVIPIRPDGSKSPAIPWKPYTHHAPTETDIRTWFTDPGNDIGVIQGTVSGNAELTEIEGRATHQLPDLKTLAHDTGLGDLWDTITTGWLELSPSGGLHFHYRVNGPVPGNTKLARTADHTVLVETRGEGGQVVVAPSRHHASGRPWTRLLGGPATAPTLTLEQREQFHTLLRTLDQAPQPEPAVSAPVTRRDPVDGLSPGDDYEQRTPWADILTPHGWQAITTRGRTTYWRRPGKTEGISATTGHADDRDRLYVFSTSTPFDTERPYTKFGAHAVLEHGGDHAAAARHLASNGYGTPRDTARRDDTLHGLIAPPTPTQQLAHADDDETPERTDDTTEQPADDDPPPTWAPVNLGPYLDGTHTPPTPTLLHRDDGHALIYPGLIHDIHGESESGKSLIAQHLATTLLNQARPVLYVDFESDANQVTRRLLDLAATPQALRDHLTYIRPEASPYTAHETPAWKTLLEQRFDLAILDGVTDALGLAGGSTKENDDIAAWHRAVPRMLTRRTGAAVILIDHVTKNTDTRGRFAIGGQAKMAAIDGASYTVEIIEPIGKGMRGTLALRVGKDRPGEIRALCGKWRSTDRTQEAARLVVDSTGTHGPGIHITIHAPETTVTDTDGDARPFKPTAIMEKLSRLLEARREPVTFNTLLRAFKADGGKARERMVADAVDQLVAGRFVVEENGPRNARMLRSAAVYRQRSDPDADAFQSGLEGLIAPPNTTASHRLPLPPGGSPVTASHRLPPVGEAEAVTHPRRSSLPPARTGVLHDYRTGINYDLHTGEVIE